MIIKRTLWLVTAVLSLSVLVSAQTVTSTVTGRVLDPKQDAVPGATVVLTNSETGLERRTVSDEVGEYTLLSIPPGKYRLTADKAPDFAVAAVQIDVLVATTSRVEDLKLIIKGTRDAVDVIDRGVKVNTTDAQIGLLVTSRQLRDLPTRTRNPYDFITLSPGSVATLASIGRGTGFAVNGQSLRSGNFLLDGGENVDPSVGGVGQLVSLDAVREYNLQTNNFQAEYGRNTGYIANVSSRTGGNLFHGSLFEFNLNSALAANSFSNNARDRERLGFNRNQFGGTLGGPIINKRLFLFASVEARQVRSGYEDVTVYVPTPELLARVSPGTKAIFNTYPVIDRLSKDDFRPATIIPFGGTTPVTIDRAFAATFRRVANFSLDGQPNTRSARDFAGSIGAPQNALLASGRLDYSLNPDTQIFGRYAFEVNDATDAQLQSFEVYGGGLSLPRRLGNQNLLINLTRTWTPRFVTESHMVYSRISQRDAQPTLPGGYSPQIELGSQANRLALPFSEYPFGLSAQNILQGVSSATWQLGNHTLKFGGQFSHLEDNRDFRFYQTIRASFGSEQDLVDGKAFLQVPIDPQGRQPGMNNGPVTAPVYARHYRYNDVGLYVQDTWKISRRLTLTPGLRWDYFGPPSSEARERQLDINFYPGAGNTPLQQIASGQFAQVDKAPGEFKGHFYLPTYTNFGPRIGAAYSLGQKTVLRSGFGLFYDRIFNNAISSTIENPLVLGLATLGPTATNPTIPYANLNTLGGQSLRDVYTLFRQDTNYQLSLNGTAIDPNFKPAYLATWNVTFEKELHNLVMSASYVGSRSKRLFSANNVNRTSSRADVGRLLVVNSKGESSYQAMQLRADSRFLEKYGLIFSFNYTLGRATDTSSAFFDSNALVLLDEETDFVNFNNLNRFETNTFGRGSTDPFNPQLDRGPSDFDVTHRVATNFVWDIPFGKSFSQGTAKRVFTGWTLSGIVTVQGGRPFSVIDTTDSTVAGLGASVRPRLTGSLPQPTLTASPTQPNTFLYLPLSNPYNVGGVGTTVTPFSRGPGLNGPYDGILGRNTFRSPGVWTTDIAVLRNVSLSRVKDGAQLQLRAEFYNLFNHANLFVNPLSVDILQNSFRTAQSGPRVPGVTASFGGVPRQIILAAKLLF